MTGMLKGFGVGIIIAGALAFIVVLASTGGDVSVGYSTVHRDPDYALAVWMLASGIVSGVLLLGFSALLAAVESIEARLVDKVVKDTINQKGQKLPVVYSRTAGRWTLEIAGHQAEREWTSLEDAKRAAWSLADKAVNP